MTEDSGRRGRATGMMDRRSERDALDRLIEAIRGRAEPGPGDTRRSGRGQDRAARAAADDGVATRKAGDLVQAVQDAIWQPAYPDSVS